MSQKNDVIVAMEKNGGYATFQQLNKLVNTSSWKTKTPAASIRKIVQVHDVFSIIADERRREQFNDIISASMYNPIRKLVRFVSYDSLVKQYAKEQIVLEDEL